MTETKAGSAAKGYRLRKPCGNCPFRSDVEKYLRPGRAQEIARSLHAGAEFPCHKTTTHYETEDGMSEVSTEDSEQCAGALITMEGEGYSTQMMRISERLGLYDRTRLDMDAPVYGSLSEWVRSYQDEDEAPTVVDSDGEEHPFEHCNVVGDDCEDPAGFLSGGGVEENLDMPTCNPLEDVCWACGSTMCSACTGPKVEPDGSEENRLCVSCAEGEE